jgi:glutathione S-transferase
VPRYRLHYFPESGNSYKLALMLTLCDQPWEPVWTDFMGDQTRSPEWRATVNEMGEIPVLEDAGTHRRVRSSSFLVTDMPLRRRERGRSLRDATLAAVG